MARFTRSLSCNRLSLLLLGIITLFTTLAAAQNNPTVLDSSRLPSCAEKCDALTSANSACVPPTAPQTSQNAYQACFCTFQSLAALYSSPQGVSCPSCSGDDMSKIQKWYSNLCTAGKVVTPGSGGGNSNGNGNGNGNDGQNGQTTTTGNDPSNTGGASSQTSSGGASIAGQSNNGASNSGNSNQSWMAGHWKWVLLLIILFLAFVIFLTLGFWLKRRHRRRRELRLSGIGHPNHPQTPSPFASGTFPNVGGASNHPQMTVVPGAGNEAAMARYDGSGVGAGSRRSMTSRHSVVSAYNAGPYPEGGAAYGSNNSQDFAAVPSPPPLAGMRQESDDSRESRRKRMRQTLRPTVEDDGIEAVGSGAERSRSRGARPSGESRASERLKNKLKRGVGK